MNKTHIAESEYAADVLKHHNVIYKYERMASDAVAGDMLNALETGQAVLVNVA